MALRSREQPLGDGRDLVQDASAWLWGRRGWGGWRLGRWPHVSLRLPARPEGTATRREKVSRAPERAPAVRGGVVGCGRGGTGPDLAPDSGRLAQGQQQRFVDRRSATSWGCFYSGNVTHTF